MRNKNQSSAAPSMTSGLRSNEPSTAGGRELRLKARPPARFNSLRSERTVNQKQEPLGNTLLAQRYTLSGNSYFWRATSSSSSETPGGVCWFTLGMNPPVSSKRFLSAFHLRWVFNSEE